MTEENTVPTKRKYKKSTVINEAIAADKPKSDKSTHYVDNATFYNELVKRRAIMDEWRANGSVLPKPRVSDAIGKCIIAIAENFSRKYNFANIPYRDEMVLDAIEHCIRYIDSFDINHTKNPFSYFTQTCYYQFIGRIENEEHETYLKYKSMLSSVVLGELAEVNDDSDDAARHILDNVNLDFSHMEDFVQRYELKMKKKSEKSKTKKVKGVDSILEEEIEE